ncbi:MULTISPECIES: 4'-phosphopantetheinyl transferase family protein [Psychrobacter]|uniref:4'-phosphopantetheinyl transferase family protein n=1 Tax=Psychrobacter TaxID=497 RepID=UPI002648F097|nr:4'-phosphopantetheinyl transferase superfamily protein [Psychrobacter sp.]MDN5619148.1 4'-phosphopantetheinyl transferase superfamily protein [Psychrobacter sp.]
MRYHTAKREVSDINALLAQDARALSDIRQHIRLTYITVALAHHQIHQLSVIVLTANFAIEAAYDCFDIDLPKALTRVSTKRKLDFLTGRLAAKLALQSFGLTHFTVLKGKHGEPLWPNGITGSISHTGDKTSCTAICCAYRQPSMQDCSAIGVDIEAKINNVCFERDEPQHYAFLNDQEAMALVEYSCGTHPNHYIYLMIFSAKESLIKAIYAKYNVLLSFLAFEYMGVSGDVMTFTVIDSTQKAQGNGLAQAVMQVQWVITEQHIITICSIS